MTAPATTAVSIIAGSAQPPARPDFKRPEYQAAQPGRALCSALMQGTTGIRALGEDALPKWPAERPEHYKIRARAAQVARYYQRTVEASVGMICSTPPALDEDADQAMADDWENIDGTGTHGEVFARRVTQAAITGGFAGILVDAPPVPDGLSLTLADEQALGLRPFWVLIPADRIISWIVDVPDWPELIAAWQRGEVTADQVRQEAKQAIIRQIVIHEPTDVPAGQFGTVCKDRYRVLSLTDTGVQFRVWELRKPSAGDSTSSTGEYFAMIAEGMMTGAKNQRLPEIPLAIVYGGMPAAPFVCEPPLLALAELNLDHYQVTADRRYLMRLCHAPTLFLAGFTDEMDETGHKKPINVGPNAVLTSTDPNAKASYVAADPAALTSSKEERDELVRQMAVLGMSFIGKDRQGQAETATGRALDDAAENATHATTARGLQNGLEQAFVFHARYRGVEPPEVTVNTTYATPQIDPQLANVIWQAVATDKLPVEAFVEYITTGQLPDDLQEQIDVLRAVAAEQANAQAAADAAARNALKSGKSVEVRDASGKVTHRIGPADPAINASGVGGPAMTSK